MTRFFNVFALAALVLFNSCSNNQPPSQGPVPTPALKVERRSVIGFDEYPTAIQGRNNNDVRAKISGYIRQVFVDEGQRVTQGHPLFRLETNILSQNTDAARAGMSAAKSNVDAALAVVRAAQIEVDKLLPLVQQKIISEVQMQTAKANLLRAQGQLSQAQAGYQQAKASYQSAAANEAYAIIRAPISGIVGKINFRTGALVSPADATPLTTVSDTRELYAYFSMNETDYLDFLARATGNSLHEKISNMGEIELLLANGSTYPEKGKIETVTGQIDPNTGTIQFRASFENKNGWLTNGNSGVIRMPRNYHDVLVIPESSTFEQQGNVFVYSIIKDTARANRIEVKARVNNLTLVNAGLSQGEWIVASGVDKIKNGTPVKPIPTSVDSVVNPVKPLFK